MMNVCSTRSITLATLISLAVVVLFSRRIDARFVPLSELQQGIMATSESGQFTLTAVNPRFDRRINWYYANDFSYSLVDIETNDTLWTRAQPKGECAPVGVLVNDDQWVAILTSYQELMIFEPESRACALDTDIWKFYSKHGYPSVPDDDTLHTSEMSGTRWGFFKHDDAMYLHIQAHDGVRLIFNLPKRALIEDVDETLQNASDAAIKKAQSLTLHRSAAIWVE